MMALGGGGGGAAAAVCCGVLWCGVSAAAVGPWRRAQGGACAANSEHGFSSCY